MKKKKRKKRKIKGQSEGSFLIIVGIIVFMLCIFFRFGFQYSDTQSLEAITWANYSKEYEVIGVIATIALVTIGLGSIIKAMSP